MVEKDLEDNTDIHKTIVKTTEPVVLRKFSFYYIFTYLQHEGG
jgi:hypothetical protein